ncbi:hypothetical protein D3C80_1262340 [compost metagenome]
MADSFQLYQFVCPGQQVLAANEQFPQKVGTQAITQNRNIQLVDDITQLLNLLFRQELTFIQQHAMYRLLLMFLCNHRIEHRLIIIELRL